tara:strand:+ start:6728 stop:7123 length:396 start_codon:yes stop_codon:yes gene_type:complete
MKFCTFCDNLLHLTETDKNELKNICATCKRVENLPKDFDPCIIKQNYGGDEKVFYECFVNKYTKHDPTLPRVSSIQCPNEECKTCKDSSVSSEVITIRYDEENMKYIYLCTHCDKCWIQPEYQNYQFIQYK